MWFRDSLSVCGFGLVVAVLGLVQTVGCGNANQPVDLGTAAQSAPSEPIPTDPQSLRQLISLKPYPGDVVEYETRESGQPSHCVRWNYKGFDPEQKLFLADFSDCEGHGGSSSKARTYHASLNIASRASIAQFRAVLEQCEKIGVRVRITVPAGTFDACKVRKGYERFWLADVPGGYVKHLISSKDDQEVTVLNRIVSRGGN